MTVSSPILTVGIPTYNRRDAVSRRIDELLAADLGPEIELLVIDNASTDGTAEQLKKRFEHDRLRVVVNEENLGYAGNVFRLFDEVSTPYLMIDSDEDAVSPDSLRALTSFCERQRPVFVSPRAQAGTNTLYRGRARTRPIEPSEFESSSFYVSGLTYDVSFIRERLEGVRAQVPANAAVTVYPQVALAGLCVAEGRGWFLDEIVTAQAESHATAITDPSGMHYATVPGRWSGFLGYEEFFIQEIAKASAEGAPRLLAMRDAIRAGFPRLILGAAAVTVPELAPIVAALTDRPNIFGRIGNAIRPSS